MPVQLRDRSAAQEGNTSRRGSAPVFRRTTPARADERPGTSLAADPTGNLDSRTGWEIMELRLELCAQRGITVIVATHNALIAARCDRVVRLLDGRVIEGLKLVSGETPEAMLEKITRLDARQ